MISMIRRIISSTLFGKFDCEGFVIPLVAEDKYRDVSCAR